MNTYVFEQLYNEGLITEKVLDDIKVAEDTRPINLQWELKTLLYMGVLCFTTGLGIIIFENLDTIGHLAIVISIACATALCFGFCIKKSAPFSPGRISSVNLLYDYTLLLGCLLLLILTGYLQFQYELFGTRWGMATFIPMIILFISAYYFDHLGVLSLAIVNLAAWAGITVTPLRMRKDNDFSDERIIFAGFALGILLSILAWVSKQKNIKQHFGFTYKNFGAHLLFISAIAAIIHFEGQELLWLLPLAGIAYFEFFQAVKKRSFYFLVITSLYSYASISYILMDLLFSTGFSENRIYLALTYFITSGLALAFFLIRCNKLLKQL
jgi:hypothetical protein